MADALVDFEKALGLGSLSPAPNPSRILDVPQRLAAALHSHGRERSVSRDEQRKARPEAEKPFGLYRQPSASQLKLYSFAWESINSKTADSSLYGVVLTTE